MPARSSRFWFWLSASLPAGVTQASHTPSVSIELLVLWGCCGGGNKMVLAIIALGSIRQECWTLLDGILVRAF